MYTVNKKKTISKEIQCAMALRSVEKSTAGGKK